jgi:hypothetical protein
VHFGAEPGVPIFAKRGYEGAASTDPETVMSSASTPMRS